jgi:hypothetical protein
MMIAAVDRVHEGDAIGTVGQTKPDNRRVEIYGLIDIERNRVL